MLNTIYVKKSRIKKKKIINFLTLLNTNIRTYLQINYLLNTKGSLNHFKKINYINSYKKYKKYYKLLSITSKINSYIQENMFHKIFFIKKNIRYNNIIIHNKYNIFSLYHKNCYNKSILFLNNNTHVLNFFNIYSYYIKNDLLYKHWNNLILAPDYNYNIFSTIIKNKKNIVNYFKSIKDITSGLILIEYIFECKKLNNKYLICPNLSLLINTCIYYESNVSKYFLYYNTYSLSKNKLILFSEITNNIFNNKYENKSSILLPNNIIISNTYSLNILIFKFYINSLRYTKQEYSTEISLMYAFNLLVESLIKQYLKNGIVIPSIQFELIAKKMTAFVKINYTAESCLLENDIFNFDKIKNLNYVYKILGYKQILYFPIILGITKSALAYSGLLSSISFQEIIKYLIKLSIESQNDWLTDFKSKIITTDLIKTGSGWYRHFTKI